MGRFVRNVWQLTYSKYKVTNLLWFAHLAREFLEVLNCINVPIYWITQALQSFLGWIWLILKISWGNKTWHFLVLSFHRLGKLKGRTHVKHDNWVSVVAWAWFLHEPSERKLLTPNASINEQTFFNTSTDKQRECEKPCMYCKTLGRVFAHWAQEILEVLNYWIVLFPPTGSHEHSKHFLGELDWSWRSFGRIKHGIFLYYLSTGLKSERVEPTRSKAIEYRPTFLAEPGERILLTPTKRPHQRPDIL